MRVAELFAGIGGFGLALERQGHEVVWANEWDKYAGDIYDKNFGDEAKAKRAREVYQKRLRIGENQGKVERYEGLGGGRPETQQYTNRSAIRQYDFTDTSKRPTGHRVDRRDITTIPASDIPDCDLLVGGVPCQAWSVAGKRRGFDDPRGNMWFEFIRVLKEKQPKYFIAENVKGLLSHDSGNSFEMLCEWLCEAGYAIDFDVLNSKSFGVAQNRERVFIVGIRVDLLDACQIF